MQGAMEKQFIQLSRPFIHIQKYPDRLVQYKSTSEWSILKHVWTVLIILTGLTRRMIIKDKKLGRGCKRASLRNWRGV